jgi:hypothetical protein
MAMTPDELGETIRQLDAEMERLRGWGAAH